MKKIKLTLGDWSDDGHCVSEDYIYITNKTVSEIRQAYKDSCILTGLQFNHNANYSGLPEHSKYGTPRHICTEYGEPDIKPLALEILKSNGIEINEKWLKRITSDEFATLIMEFIKLSLPYLEYEEGSYKKSELKEIPPINGWWNKELNEGFGYGLYDAD
jgi:hypothetical protein